VWAAALGIKRYEMDKSAQACWPRLMIDEKCEIADASFGSGVSFS